MVAAAPSEMLDELAAVTVPFSLRKAGFRVGILAMSDLPGCSSVANSASPLRVLTVTGTISSAKAPDAMRGLGAPYRFEAKASCSSRVNAYLSAVASANTPIDWPS